MVSNARKKLNDFGTERLLLSLQLLNGVVWLVGIVQTSLAGSFPPDPPASQAWQVGSHLVWIWCVLSIVAALAILSKKHWGWWVELFVVLPFPVLIFFFWKEVIPFTIESLDDFMSFIRNVVLTVAIVQLLLYVGRRIEEGNSNLANKAE